MTVVDIDEARIEEFALRVAADQNAGVVGVLAYIADRIGLWGSLASSGPVHPDELADITGLHPVYLGECLAALASAQYLEYDDATGRFFLPPEHAFVLADDDSPASLVGGFEFQAGCWADADRIAELFASGEGLPSSRRDERIGHGVARFFRPLYRESLVTSWLPSLRGVVDKLTAGARVLDVGCGRGFATSLIAEAFPASSVVGIDLDAGAIEEARSTAELSGLQNVDFRVAAAGEDVGEGWDVICVFDAFHHIGDPVAVAKRLKGSLSADGTLMLVEPLSRDSVEDNIDAAGALYYAPSTLVCLPDALAQGHGMALGAQAGPKRILGILAKAGFSSARVATESEFNLVIEAEH